MNGTIGTGIDLDAVRAKYETERVKCIRRFRGKCEHRLQYGHEESLT